MAGQVQTLAHCLNIQRLRSKPPPPKQTPKTLPYKMARDLAPDWILQETLAIQAQTAQWFKDKQAEHAGQKPLTLTVLGCGMRQHYHEVNTIR